MIKTLLLCLGSAIGLLSLAVMSGLYLIPAALISHDLLAGAHPIDVRDPSLRVIQESPSLEDARGSFWLNSGGWVHVRNNLLEPIHEELPSVSYWRIRYRVTNPTDTDNGYHPQNLFRLITTSAFIDSKQEVFARIDAINESDSPNRNESNGILIMSRYSDDDNLYYAGLRVDGFAVIKEKRNGVYETLDLTPVFANPQAPYNRELRPNLLPEHEWLGLRLVTHTRADGSTELTLYLQNGDTWEKVAAARDTTPLNSGVLTHGGLRSDFMDVSFRNYRVEAP